MKLRIDFDSEHPELTVCFDDMDDLLGFLVGFCEVIADE